ncbi:MAG: hypothetical protein ACI94Y_000881 [Maribacter sp.]|jgi:hypothetical protein
MRWDKDRLQSLSDNLDISLKESIYRNAFPISIDRIDISTASLSDAFSTQFIKQLLNGGNVDAEIQASEDDGHKFHHLYIEHTNQKHDKGIHDLCFGYPMFIHKDEYSLNPIAAPFFTWSVEMEASQFRTNTWSLKRGVKNTIKANKFLINYLKEKFDLDLEASMEEMARSGSLDAGKLSAFCNNISVKLDIPGNTSGYNIIPSPNTEEIKELESEPVIRFSGTLGIYGHNHLHLSDYIHKKIELVDDQPMIADEVVSPDFSHPFSLVKPDPCQKNVALQVAKNAVTLAEGAAGTGKTYTAIHIASNALANGKTCLIVSPNISGLQQIHTTLNSKQVGALSYLIKDADNDLSDFFYALKQLSQKNKKSTKDQDLGFKILLERALNKHDKINAHHQLMNKQAFGSFDFTDTVGHFIESNRDAGKDILSGKLNPREYKFTFREYDILKTDIAKGERLFKNVKRLNHPLRVLHEELFLDQNLEKSEAFINKQVASYRSKTEDLLRRFTEGLESYRDNLRNHYESHAKELNEKHQDILTKISEYAQVFGEDFKKSSNMKAQMYGVFSDTYFNIKEAKKEINQEFSELAELYNEKRYFNYKFPKNKDVDTIQNIQIYLSDFGETLIDWTDNIGLGVKQESEALNSQSVQIQLDYKSRIGELEYMHDVLLEELNQTKLFKEWFSYDSMTLSRRLRSLESLNELLDTTEQNMSSFENFFPWQKHWLEILPITKETITALVKSYAKNWLPAFKSWYFYNCLSDRSFLSAAVDDKFRDNYLDQLTHLRNQLPSLIGSLWSYRKSESLDSLRKRDKKMYQLLTGKKSQLSADMQLKDLFNTYAKEIPCCFPILMMTPDVAEELLASAAMEFDLVIFDDAHLIPTLQAMPITEKAKRMLAIGDRQQSLFDNKKILLHGMIETGIGVTPLYYKHTHSEKACSDFLNFTSYQKGIKNINYYANDYKIQGIFIKPSEGNRYDEDNRSNNLEAEHLVRILAEIPSKSDGTMALTAIVTSTISQRDHISSYLLYLKQKRNPFCDKIIKLEESGLRVLHVSELNQHYDNIVWSLTYGTTNLRGHITQHFNEMESSFGQAALNIILGHTLESLIVCSSIPMSYVKNKVKNDPNSCGPMVRFLNYCAVTAEMDGKLRHEYLEEIEWPSLRSNHKDRNKFIVQVRKELEPYFEQDRIKLISPLAEIGTAAITISPLNFRQPIPLIVGDALDRGMSTVASEFERSVYRKLEETGYKVFKTNSLDWWRNPKREARMLASRLIKADSTIPLPEKILENGVK